MAKKTKDSNLSLEERLEQALIPNWDEPYRLPPNWCWIKLSALSSIISKGTTPTGGKSAYVTEGVHFLRIENINDDGTISHDNIACVTEEMHTGFLKRSILEERDVLVSIAGTLGKTGLVRDIDLPLNTNQAIAFVRLNSETINESYIKSAIDSPVMQKFLLGKTKVTSIPNLTLEIIGDCPIPLAPFNEQQRIVACIESFFAKLDEAKEKAQEVVDGFETRKAAILHKALSGELTAKWREKSGADIDNWDTKEIGDFSFVTKLAGFEYTKNIAPNLVDYGIPLFKGKNVQKGNLVLEFESFIPKSVSDELPRSKLTKKCLLTPYVGTIGNIALFDGSFEAHLGSNVGKIEIESDTFEEYLLYYIRSDYGYKELTKQKKATAQESISIQALREVKVLLPTLAEQHEIVRVLDNLISKEQQIKETAEAVIEQIDKMKKAILARAFRGELGTNDPSEESAVELLKRVLSGGEN